MSELPPGWKRKRLGELVKVSYGKGLKSSNRSGTGGIPVIGSSGVVGSHDVALVEGPVVVVGRKGNVGAAFLADKPSWPIDTTYYLRVPPDLEPRFLTYQINHLKLEALDSSTAVPSLRRPDLEAAQVTVPPIDEQERIVEAIEEQFSRLDAGVESLHQATRNLTRLRSAVLKAAVEGLLVPQDPTEGTGWALIERIAERRIAEQTATTKPKPARPAPTHHAPASWGSATLEEVTDPIRAICYGILKPKTRGALTVPYVEVRDIRDGRVRVTGLNRTTAELHAQFPRSHLREGDVLIAVRGSYDRSAVVPAALAGANISRDVARIAPIDGLVPEYLALYLHSPPVLAHFRRIARGVAVKGINIGSIRELRVMVPPTAEQRRIVAESDRQISIVDAIAVATNVGVKRANALRRSILSQAFNGRLSKGPIA